MLNEKELQSTKLVKSSPISPPVLALPDLTGHLTIDTDACDVQVGCALLRKQPDKTVEQIGYWSRSLTDAKRRYDMTQRESLATAWAVFLLHPYLENTIFTIRTDYDSI